MVIFALLAALLAAGGALSCEIPSYRGIYPPDVPRLEFDEKGRQDLHPINVNLTTGEPVHDPAWPTVFWTPELLERYVSWRNPFGRPFSLFSLLSDTSLDAKHRHGMRLVIGASMPLSAAAPGTTKYKPPIKGWCNFPYLIDEFDYLLDVLIRKNRKNNRRIFKNVIQKTYIENFLKITHEDNYRYKNSNNYRAFEITQYSIFSAIDALFAEFFALYTAPDYVHGTLDVEVELFLKKTIDYSIPIENDDYLNNLCKAKIDLIIDLVNCINDYSIDFNVEFGDTLIGYDARWFLFMLYRLGEPLPVSYGDVPRSTD